MIGFIVSLVVALVVAKMKYQIELYTFCTGCKYYENMYRRLTETLFYLQKARQDTVLCKYNMKAE